MERGSEVLARGARWVGRTWPAALCAAACGGAPSSPPQNAEMAVKHRSSTVPAPASALSQTASAAPPVEPWQPPDVAQLERPADALPLTRSEGRYLVNNYPRPRSAEDLRLAARGKWTESGGKFVWVGPTIPPKIPLLIEGQNLAEIEELADGSHFVLYRQGKDPRCNYPGICPVSAALFDREQRLVFRIALDEWFPKPERRELADARYADGLVFFNDVGLGYAREHGGKCSHVIAIDPIAKKRIWISAPLVSHTKLFVTPAGIVTAYGFTAEPDYAYLLDTKTGRTLAKKPVNGTPSRIWKRDDGKYILETNHADFALEPKLAPKPTLLVEQIGGPK